jgi:hypothetical protein
MSRYVLPPNPPNPTQKQFMTYFEEAWAFSPYPSELNICLLGELFPDTLPYQLYVSYKAYNTNSVFISEFAKKFFFLETGIMKISASPLTTFGNVAPTGTKYITVSIEASTPSATVEVAIKRVNLACASPNCVPLRWLNNLGGWDFFCFEGTVEFLQSNEHKEAYRYLARNPSVIESPSAFLCKVACNENINDKNIAGIASLFTAREIYWFDRDNRMYRYRPLKSYPFVPVKIKPNTVLISENRKGTYDVSFELTISEQNT